MKTTDTSLKFLLALVAILLAANLITSSGLTTSRKAVAAGIPDSGAQLQAVVDEVKNVNTKLEGIQKTLDSGNLTVKCKLPEKDSK